MSRRALRAGATVALGFGLLVAISNSTQTVVANGDTRTLSMLHRHTGEQILVTFKRNGRYDADALNKLNWFLRDWRRDEPTRMDPHLFDIVWEVYRSVGAQSQIHVVSAYRSAGTNAMLRRRSRAVAQQSRHITGQAMDFYIPGASMVRVREAGMLLQRGGVGFYPGSASQFVHMDTGSVRHWPKVSRDYLARLFPDGRTVHIPADGRPLAGFETALAMVRGRGGSASRFYDSRADESASFEDADDRGGVIRQRSNSMGLLAGLFGGTGRQQQPRAAAPAPQQPAAARAPEPAAAPAAQQPVPTSIAQPAPVQAPPGRPVQIVASQPRMLIAAAPLPQRAPSAALRLRAGEEEDEQLLAAAPLPPSRPAIPGEAAPQTTTTFASLAPGGLPVPRPADQARPSVLPEAGQVALAQAPVPSARPQVLGNAAPAPSLPPLITTGEQRGSQPEAAPPPMALAFASPSRPASLSQGPQGTSLQGPQPARPAPQARAAAQPRPQARPVRVAAAPLMVAPSAEGAGAGVVFARQATDRAAAAASLQAPDPRQQRLIEQPVQMVAMAFSVSASATVPSQRFQGHSVSALRTIEFAAPEARPQRRAFLSR